MITELAGTWENPSQALEMFTILISAAVKYVEGNSTVHLTFVYFTVCKLYFKKGGESRRCHDNLALNTEKCIS